MTEDPTRTEHARGGLMPAITRVWVPVAIAVAGLAGIVVGRGSANSPWAAGGVGLIIVALIVWMINWMFRLAVQSNHDREREERARRHYERHGRWPDGE